MEQLATPLVCLTLQHIIDDVNAVEGLLQENPNIERCIPLSLKDVLKMPSIPNATTTLAYLQGLWHIIPNIRSPYDVLAARGLTYLLPYVDANPSTEMLDDSLSVAAENGYLDTVRYLIKLLFQSKPDNLPDLLARSLDSAAQHGRVDVLKYILLVMKLRLEPGIRYFTIYKVANAVRSRYNRLLITELATPEELNQLEQIVSILKNAEEDAITASHSLE